MKVEREKEEEEEEKEEEEENAGARRKLAAQKTKLAGGLARGGLINRMALVVTTRKTWCDQS